MFLIFAQVAFINERHHRERSNQSETRRAREEHRAEDK